MIKQNKIFSVMLVFKLENFNFIENLLRGDKEIEDSNNTIC